MGKGMVQQYGAATNHTSSPLNVVTGVCMAYLVG